MNISGARRIGIIGGGVAGLSCAYFLQQQGLEPVVYETAPVLGGLASSLELAPGVSIERFYHFICQPDVDLLRLSEALGLQVRWRETRMALFNSGVLHPFGSPLELLRFSPLKPLDRLRVGLHVLKARRLKDWHGLDGLTAERWLRQELGDEAYQVIWEPLLAMKFGAEHPAISAAWIWSRIARVARSRSGLLQKEKLGYLEGGTQALLTALAERLGPRVRLGQAVEQVVFEHGRAVGLRVGGKVERYDAVVSTVPLRLLSRLAPGLPEGYRAQLEGVDYIGVSCLLLKLKRSFSPYFWTNVSDPSVPFAGCIEYTRLNPLPTLSGRAVLYVPHYLSAQEERYAWELDRVLTEYLPSLRRMNPDFRASDIEDARLSKAPYAQVLCRTGFAALVPPFHAPMEGLYLTDSTQLYPEDRVISDLIRCAERVSELVLRYVGTPTEKGRGEG
ncbi:MAG: NAD(P)/FAD-dependent oxidoreductase [Myxococcota bacterium]